MQLSFGLDKVGQPVDANLPKFQRAVESNAFTPLAGCVLEHIISTSHLSDLEKFFYILVNTLSVVNLHGGNQRAIALSAESWSERLNCAKSQIFAMQNSLEAKGYFIISRDRNKHGQNKRNLICPTLPDNVFKDLSQNAVSRVGGQELYYVPNYESKLQYLDRTKLFIILGYQVLKDIASCEYLSPFHKLVWLDCYTSCYKARVTNFGAVSNNKGLEFSFIASYQQLQDRYSCNKSILSKTLAELEELGLIKREHFYTKKELGCQERQDRSLWKISLLSTEQLSSGDKPSGAGNNSGNNVDNNSSSNFNMASVSSNSINNTPTLLIKEHNLVPLINRNGNGNVSDTNSFKTNNLSEDKDRYINHIVSELAEDNGFNGSLDESVEFYNDKFNENSSEESDFQSYEGFSFASDIILDDPEVILSSLSNIKDNTIYISKSNLVNKYKSEIIVGGNIFFKSAEINNKTSTLYCPNTTKNLGKMVVGGEGGRITSIGGVYREEIFKKENTRKTSEFNVSSLLIKERLKLLSKDKADKARKFAYSLFSKKLTKGYASTLSKHELAKQFIFHASSWKPTKVDRSASDDKLVDIALSVAWNAVVKGSWQEPLEWAKAKALQYEFLSYKNKFKDSGIISKELKSLESMINNLLRNNYNLENIISQEVEKKTNEIMKITEVQDDRMSENKQEEGRATGAVIQITIATSTWELQPLVTPHRLPQITQINQEPLALYDLSGAEEDYQILTHFVEGREEQSMNFLTTQDLISQNVDRKGEGNVFRNNGDSTASIQELISQFASLNINNFSEHTFDDDRTFSSFPTDDGFSRNLLEKRVYFNLPGNSNGYYKSDLAADNYQKYTAKLKLCEVNDKGELVITLQPGDPITDASPLATHEATSINQVNNSNLELELGTDQDSIYGQIEGQTDLLISSGQHLRKDFTKIDQALSGILKNLKRGN